MTNYKFVLGLMLAATTCFSQTLTNDGTLVTMSENISLTLSNGDIQNINNGMIKGDGSILCNSFINNSDLTVGNNNTIGVLSIDGILDNETTSSINLKIEGNNGVGVVGGHDILEVDGDLYLDNTLNISFTNGFMPSITDEFTIITYTGSLIDSFQQVNLSTTIIGFEIDYTTQGEIKLKASQLSVEDFDENPISIFPNPTSSILNIKAVNTIDEIVVIDLFGKVISKHKPINDSINVSAFSKGMYLLKIKINNTVVTKKLIIK